MALDISASDQAETETVAPLWGPKERVPMVTAHNVEAASTSENNSPPVTAPDALETNESTPLWQVDVLANDSDPDGDALTLDAAEISGGGVVTVNPDNTLTFDPAGDFPLAGASTTETTTVTYTVSDGTDTATGTLTITVRGLITTGPRDDLWSVRRDQSTQIDGAAGNDLIETGDVEDVLLGGDGGDTLDGGGFDDVLNGNGGVDLLIGGRGDDRFVFDPSAAGSTDVIRDFEGAGAAGGDLLVIRGFAGVTELEDLAQTVVDGSLYVSAADGNGGLLFTARLLGVTEMLTAEDFLFD